MKEILIIDIIKGKFAVSPEDGEIVYERIKEILEKEAAVTIDFSGIDIITTAFLYKSIGRLYEDFSKDSLNNYISMKNISKLDIQLIKRLIERDNITLNEDTVDFIKDVFKDK